ncbi:MAG: helix-turn-helix domain-containing protein [Clostridia bacterium]|nr:helix-turn-helix domain-containing protein [Clostridia bacterium]
MNQSEYYYLNMTERDCPGYCTQLARELTDGSYRWRKVNLPRHMIDYVVRGSGFIEYRGETRRVRAGDLIYIRRGADVYYYADPDDPYEKYWMGMQGRLIDDMAADFFGSRELVIATGENASALRQLITQTKLDGMTDESLLHCVLSLFVRLAAAESSRQDGLAGEIRAHIDTHIGDRDTLDDIAERFHISKRHMIRLFKERYNQTPGAYRSEARLISATHYLAETTLSIGEIASILGFCDQSFFSTAFKKRFGVYPLAYRASNSL